MGTPPHYVGEGEHLPWTISHAAILDPGLWRSGKLSKSRNSRFITKAEGGYQEFHPCSFSLLRQLPRAPLAYPRLPANPRAAVRAWMVMEELKRSCQDTAAWFAIRPGGRFQASTAPITVSMPSRDCTRNVPSSPARRRSSPNAVATTGNPSALYS